MSLRVYTKKSKEKLKLHPKPFASGGEGKLYKILSPTTYKNYVVKIYHAHKLGPSRTAKIHYLQEHPPQGVEEDSIVWIHDIVENERGHFLGFVMPFIKGEKLEILCTPKLPRKLDNTWYRFHFDSPEAIEFRLKVCYNLAAAIHQIHESGRYILVDLKPDNVIITSEGLVALVDLDSVEVVENGVKLFDAPVATPEYTPPEFYQPSKSDPTQQQAWDRFSLAVIFYKLLMGVHPFAGAFYKPYDKATSLAQKIELGLFVHHPALQKKTAAIPPLHQAFHSLGSKLQELFMTCFVDGATAAQLRPTAHEWCSAIMQHLDVHRLRVLPSKKISLPVSLEDLSHLQEKKPSTNTYLEQLDIAPLGVDDRNIAITGQKLDLGYLLPWRRVNMIILVIGISLSISFLFQQKYDLGTFTFMLTFVLFVAFIYLSFSRRVSYRKLEEVFYNFKESQAFYNKQQNIYTGIKRHLDHFYERLLEEQQRLFPKQFNVTKQNIDQEVEASLKSLHLKMEKTDKVAKDLMDSEIFEFNALKDKYNRALHTFPAFSNATSLDAELAAIDFALQQEMEHLQKILGRDLKARRLEYDAIFEKDQLILEKKEGEYYKKIGKFKKQTEQAKKQEIRKLLTKLKRQLAIDLISVEKNADTRLTMFKDDILAFLDKHNITKISQIKNIEAPGKITLLNNRVLSIAPLKYYQIHELTDWWQTVAKGLVNLPHYVIKDIEKRYDTEYETFKEKALKEYTRVELATNKRKNKLTLEAQKVYKELRDQNKPQIAALKEKYSAQKEFLQKLLKDRSEEEQEIHTRYETKFDQLEQDLQDKSDQTNKLIQGLCQLQQFDKKQIQSFQKNLKKYHLGLRRLEEEHGRLIDLEERYEIAKLTKLFYDKMDFKDHFQKMLFLKPIVPKK